MEQKNIEISGGGLKCDNPTCDWADNTITFENYREWLNRPCPKCGSNLLTERDYKNAETVRLATDFINTLSPEDLQELGALMSPEVISALKDNPILKDTTGIDFLPDEKVVVTVSTHKEIKFEEIKKAD